VLRRSPGQGDPPGTPPFAHDIAFGPSAPPYLMRRDYVDFDLAADAVPHRHKGGGIR
jgi:hypothetical protein